MECRLTAEGLRRSPGLGALKLVSGDRGFRLRGLGVFGFRA